MSPIVGKEEIQNYIPQHPPIMMIDNIMMCDEQRVETGFLVREDELFLLGGKLSESGLLENIAQSAAAKVGYECHQRNVPVPLGFIGGISKVKVNALPSVGSTIKTVVNIDKEIFGVTIIKGESFLEDESLVSCEMKIIIAEVPA
ncbi:MAG: 3-hydroxyacyl-ACP dehydratase [Reichenbachiella sp.]